MSTHSVIYIFVFYFLLNSSGISQSLEDDNIVHLDLRITSDHIELLNTKITEGRLKSLHQIKDFAKNNIYFEILSGKNQELYNSTIPNPLNRYIEYADEDGNLSQTKIVSDTALISIRLPYHREINRIDFYKITGDKLNKEFLNQNLQKIESITIDLKNEDE